MTLYLPLVVIFVFYNFLVKHSIKINIFSVWTTTDPDQSIYGFRNAEPKNFQKMQNDFSDIGVINMEQNYRSTGKILKAALHVIQQGKRKMCRHSISRCICNLSLFSYFRFESFQQIIAHHQSRWKTNFSYLNWWRKFTSWICGNWNSEGYCCFKGSDQL